MQLRQHQMEQRKEKQQAKSSSMDEMLGSTSKTESKSTGLSQASMTSLISADNSMKQAKVQGSVSSQFEGKAGVLEIEIKLDESRAVNGLAANTEGKKAELADVEQKAMDAAATQMETLGDVNKSLEEANKADEQSDKADKKSTQSQAKGEENISSTDEQEEAVSVAENVQSDEISQQPTKYPSIDIRL